MADLVVTSPEAVDQLVKDGKVPPPVASIFVQSGVGVAGASRGTQPDISTPAAFKKTLLAAPSRWHHQGPSGIYL